MREGTHRGISAGTLVADKTPVSKVRQADPSRFTAPRALPAGTSHLQNRCGLNEDPLFQAATLGPYASPIGRGARGGGITPT